MVQFLCHDQSPLLAVTDIYMTCEMRANYCREGGMNQQQCLQKYPRADILVMADQDDTHQMILGVKCKHRAGWCGIDVKSCLYRLENNVLFFFSAYTLTVSCLDFSWSRTLCPSSKATLLALLTIDWFIHSFIVPLLLSLLFLPLN